MKISNLHKSFGDKSIFKSLSYNFEDGKVTALMGESGIGKTTLLRIIAGLDNDYTGSIERPTRISYVFQEPRLFSQISVLDNIKIVNDFPKHDVMKLLDLVELGECANMYPSELSGGMKIRLSLARAIYYNADLILLDEPFASLDEDTKNRIAPKIFKLLENKTIIFVTHNQNDAIKYSDNIIKI